MQFEDITGKTFSNLLITSDPKEKVNGNAIVYCTCTACGKENVRRFKAQIRNGSSKHCGCLTNENRTLGQIKHGCTSTSFYRSWAYLNTRGRLCPEWRNFLTVVAFFNYESLDHRITEVSSDRLIGPDNYQLLPPGVSSKAVLVSVNGVTKQLYEWAALLDVSRQYVHQLHQKGTLVSRVMKDVFSEG